MSSITHKPESTSASHVHFNFSWAIIQDCPCGCTANDPESVTIEDELSDVMDTLRYTQRVSVRTILDMLQVIQRKRSAVLRNDSNGVAQALTVTMLMTELGEA